MSQPRPKQNFLQTFLIVTTLWLGFLLIFNRQQPTNAQNDKSTSADVLAQLRDSNLKVNEVSAMHALSFYKDKLNDEAKRQVISPEQKEKLELEGDILLADTQLKAYVVKTLKGDPSDGTTLQQAYLALHNVEKQFKDKPIWKDLAVPVADMTGNKNFAREGSPWMSWTGEKLHAEVVQRLSNKYKGDLLLGFIPGYQVIDTLVALTGRNPGFSYAFAAFLLALIVRAIVYPLAQRQLMWSRQMSQLQPMVQEIKKQYTDKKTKQVTNPQEFQMKTMELYKEYGLNPLAGCAPALLQMPLFLIVYQCMLHYQFEFQKGTFLWMNPGSGSAFAHNLGQQDNVMIVIYGITMICSTLLTPVTDPAQKVQQKAIGIVIGVLFTVFMFLGWFPVPGAFVLYWTFTNLLAMAQSIRAYRMPVPPLQKVNAPGGGVYPAAPSGKKGGFLDKLQEQMRQAYEADQAKKEPAAKSSSNGSPTPPATNQNGKAKPSDNPSGPKRKPKSRKDSASAD